MKAIFVFTILSLSFASFGQRFSPLMGNFKVVSAQCSGESFLWKKNDSVVLSGNILAIGGVHEKIEMGENEECRFQDIYTRVKQSSSFSGDEAREESVLISEFKRITCWKLKNGERIGNPVIVKEKVVNPLSMVEIQKKGGQIDITIDERDLCDSQVTLELAHKTQ
jgi:hypothetical protein